jgi:hypothetical protein
MDAPVDESTATAAKRLQQALEQRSRGRPRLDTSVGPDERGADSRRGRAARRTRIIRIAQIGFSVAIVVAIFAYAIPKFADYRSVWAVLQRLTWPQLGLLVAATLFNLLTYWLQLMAALPGLTLAQAAVNYQTTTSIANTVPAVGGALSVGFSYAMLRSWGFSLAAVTLMTLLTGIWTPSSSSACRSSRLRCWPSPAAAPSPC